MVRKADIAWLVQECQLSYFLCPRADRAQSPRASQIRRAILVQAARKWAWDHPHCVWTRRKVAPPEQAQRRGRVQGRCRTQGERAV